MAKTKSRIKQVVNEILDSRIAVVDGGNGSTVAITNLGSTGIQIIHKQVARMPVSGFVAGNGSTEIDMKRVYHWNGIDYVHGDDITFGNPQQVQLGYGDKRYGSEHHLMNITVALCDLFQVPSNQPIDLAITIPPGILIQEPDIVNEVKRAIGDKLEITLTENGETFDYEFNINSVTIVEEAKTIRHLIAIDNQGQDVKDWRKKMYGRYWIADQGAFTFNNAILNNGNFEPLPAEIQSIKDLGLRNGVHDVIIAKMGLQNKVTVAEIDRALRDKKGIVNAVTGRYKLDKSIINETLKSHFDNVMSTMQRANINTNTVNGVIAFGGGMNTLEDYFSQYLVNDNVLHDVAEVGYEALTALGAYRAMKRKLG